jgi:hypothetical protein
VGVVEWFRLQRVGACGGGEPAETATRKSEGEQEWGLGERWHEVSGDTSMGALVGKSSEHERAVCAELGHAEGLQAAMAEAVSKAEQEAIVGLLL